MTVDEAARIVLAGQAENHEMLVQTIFLLRCSMWFLGVATVMGLFVVAAQIYEVFLHLRTVRKINGFLDWAQKYMDHQGPIQEQVLSLIAMVQEKTTGTLNKIEDTVKKGTEASAEASKTATEMAAAKAAEVMATVLSSSSVPPSDPGNKIPVVQGV